METNGTGGDGTVVEVSNHKVGHGDRIEWNQENSLALSSYMVRNGNGR